LTSATFGFAMILFCAWLCFTALRPKTRMLLRWRAGSVPMPLYQVNLDLIMLKSLAINKALRYVPGRGLAPFRITSVWPQLPLTRSCARLSGLTTRVKVRFGHSAKNTSAATCIFDDGTTFPAILQQTSETLSASKGETLLCHNRTARTSLVRTAMAEAI